MDRAVALQNLIEATSCLDSYGCTYWLSDGTLLGMVRENDFIAHDHDTDVAVLADTFTPNVIHELIRRRFHIVVTNGRVQDGLSITLERSNVRLDLFLYYSDKPHTVRYSCWKHFKLGRAYKVDYTYPEVVRTKKAFLGNEFWVPENAEKYLELEYGPDWRTPKKRWNGIIDPCNKQVTDVVNYVYEDRKQFNSWLNSCET
ncbi:LicD family protein [Candidatus Saccharibacteria bacterium]|nr:LicD family protein [Candidatus Saccharibacteria bacterium]